ncbi:conserved exported hypothetical protein [Tenacibaculum sp. 190524A02b]|uniref:Uncharacterized protein n=1 Tax=Tenacibaculum vairaonense TaxID=3137860 RepID=A0ABP1FBL2_9FLAO
MKKVIIAACVLASGTFFAQMKNNAFRLDNDYGDFYMRRYVDGDTTWKRALVSGKRDLILNFQGDYPDGVAVHGKELKVNGILKINPASNIDGESSGLVYAFGAGDDFLYDGKYINHYGFGFHDFKDSATSPNGVNSYISGYFGIDLFTGGQNRLRIRNNGNVGIGTNSPDRKLDIESSDFIVSRITRTTSGGGVVSEAVNGNGESWRYGVGGGVNSKFSIYQSTKSFGEGFLIDSEGNIGIGSKSPDSKLTVNGTIHSKEVRVDLQIPADYVFEKYYEGASTLKADYKMPTLEEVEAFTKKNHHLPAIPSAAKIQEEGLHLKEMTNLLLQKIEELTLYTIEQEKRIKTLEKKLATK